MKETTSNPPGSSEFFLTRPDLVRRWQSSIPTIKRREKDGTLKPLRLPGCRSVRYRLSDIVTLEEAAID